VVVVLDQIEIALVLILGIAIGYFIRAAMSAARRRKARLFRERSAMALKLLTAARTGIPIGGELTAS
jgi:hypothetical protein